VQVIEQYPETGRRVFQLVYDEFDKFLSRFLSEHGSVARVVSVAQQVEQKETMTIQYTIEMRNMLNDMPVRDEIREFLFKVWAEVLSIAAMKNGPQHEETLTLKRAAADLVWAASAKPNRNDRARVIADLPKLLQLLRLGMSMLGLGMCRPGRPPENHQRHAGRCLHVQDRRHPWSGWRPWPSG
jgi:MoxR-like ATPase